MKAKAAIWTTMRYSGIALLAVAIAAIVRIALLGDLGTRIVVSWRI
jgi:hypothetical protein